MDELMYVGNEAQLLDVRNYRFEGGRAHGLRATDVANETGLRFTVLADRCMDIAALSYKGINMSFIGPCGYVGPQYCEATGLNWLRSFTAGFMTTCGLDNVGSPCVDNGQEYGLHGRMSSLPADQYCASTRMVDGKLEATLTGEMNQSVIFGDKLKLRREIRAFQDRDRIEVVDEICNTGYREQEYMILYHCNIGYPFLSPGCQLTIDSESTAPRDAHANQYMDARLAITEPDDLDEMCYYHKMRDNGGVSTAGLYQPKYNIGMTMTWENHILDHLVQWKNLSKGQYVMGLEPASNTADGKAAQRKDGVIKTLAAGQSVRHKLVFQFYSK